MAKVIKSLAPRSGGRAPAAGGPKRPGDGHADSSALLKGIWVVTVLLWPLLKYVVILDCVFQFFRMLWLWNTPGTFAGFAFLLHFSVLVGLTCFVSIYQPKGL